MAPVDNNPDARQRRCPRLGGDITFAYCRSCGESGTVCFKILDCWWERFDILSYLKKRLTPEEFESLQEAKPPSKIKSLIELIQEAKRNAASGDC